MINQTRTMLFLALAACTQLALAQCATEKEAKATLVTLGTAIEQGRAFHDIALEAVLAQIDANGTRLKWDGKRRGDFVAQLMKEPAFLRAEESKKEQMKKIEAVKEELDKLKPNPDVKALCSVVIKYDAPFQAVARLNNEQVDGLKAAAAAMK